ncbi:MAG TPA: hypothetical protein V6D29_16810, partial [Leptolyngbyaceae cyanobacterium]
KFAPGTPFAFHRLAQYETDPYDLTDLLKRARKIRIVDAASVLVARSVAPSPSVKTIVQMQKCSGRKPKDPATGIQGFEAF